MKRSGLLRVLKKILFWTAFAGVMLAAAIGVLDELLDPPVLARLLARVGISDYFVFCYAVGGVSLAVLALLYWLDCRPCSRSCRGPAERSSPEKENSFYER